ncbi:hypothetical protein LR48_Vigan01g120200 [Vigna angularis]|uniref:Uncharacterized protein n=1 Tax=Phaseolus angularis TaxID=3914 RepID=A0A0L9TMI1_PHAAN|nr:hypothetical protein LR48_Vigan01g120200 [Vigna angularis]
MPPLNARALALNASLRGSLGCFLPNSFNYVVDDEYEVAFSYTRWRSEDDAKECLAIKAEISSTHKVWPTRSLMLGASLRLGIYPVEEEAKKPYLTVCNSQKPQVVEEGITYFKKWVPPRGFHSTESGATTIE